MDSVKHLCMVCAAGISSNGILATLTVQCLELHLASLMKGLEKLKELMSSAPQFIKSFSYWLMTCFNALASTLRFCKVHAQDTSSIASCFFTIMFSEC